MGGGLAFLTKKSFNPANWTNQKQVWEARQKETIEKRRLAERDAQLKREREEEELARAIGGQEGGGRKALSFMYDGGKVPGLERRKGGGGNDDRGEGFEGGEGEGWRNRGKDNEDTTEKKMVEIERQSLYERQPGDDDAAAAFREMLARGTTGDEDESTSLYAASDTRPDDGGAAVKDGTTDEMLRGGDNRTNLEKAVGRNRLGVDITLAQQMERFPMLKGAPRALPPKPASSGVDGDKDAPTDSDVVALNFKPLGQVLRNVRCCKCSEWGHSMGDRECKLTGWDPFSSTPRLPPVATAAVATSAAIISDAIDVVHHESRNASAETLEDERKQKKEWKQKKENKRHRKDERKRHARDDEKRSRKDKRAKSSKRHRRDRSPSYSSSSYSSSGDESFDSRDRCSSKRGVDRYSRKRQHNRDHHRRRDSDTSSSDDRRHRLSKDSGSKRREKSTSQRRPERSRSRSRSSSRSSVRRGRNSGPSHDNRRSTRERDGISSNNEIDDGGRYHETGAISFNVTKEEEIKEKLLRRKILNKRRRD